MTEPSRSEYSAFIDALNRSDSTDGFKVVHDNLSWTGAYITTPKGNKYIAVHNGRWNCYYRLYRYKTDEIMPWKQVGKQVTKREFVNINEVREYLKKRERI